MNDKFLTAGAIITTQLHQLRIGWGASKWQASPCDAFSFYFPKFFLEEENPWISFSNEQNTTIDSLIADLENFSAQAPNPSFQIANYEAFERQFDLFMQSDLKKAVPYTFCNANEKMTAEKLNYCLLNLLKYAKKNRVYIFGFWNETGGILGGTPELLFSSENGKVDTVAIASTLPVDRATEFEHDLKLKIEHQIVIDGIFDTLKPFGTVKIGQTKTLFLTKLAHLLTPIQLCGSIDFQTLTKALHPTPALGTYPREEGKQWLEMCNAILPRERFGTPVGFFEKGKGVCYVAIRNLQWNEEKLSIGVGCGVVKESQKELEWKELVLKIEAIRAIFAI